MGEVRKAHETHGAMKKITEPRQRWQAPSRGCNPHESRSDGGIPDVGDNPRTAAVGDNPRETVSQPWVQPT